jgi:Tfp pilus assembly protein PilX
MKKIKDNEQGIVSILVSMVMMIVLTLLVLGLAQIGVSDQKNALKRQLSTTAYYLAESGINKAINDSTNLIDGRSKNTTCSTTITTFSQNASIPCVITQSSGTLTDSYYQLSNGQSKVIPIINTLTNAITSGIGYLNFVWSSPPSTSSLFSKCSNSTSNLILTKVSGWGCPVPIIMINLVSADLLAPGQPTANLFNEGLDKGVATAYLYPTQVAGLTTKISGINDIIPVTCSQSDNSVKCSAKVDITGMKVSTKYYMRVTPIYGSSALTFSAYDSANTAIYSAQASIDSTGKVGTTSQRLYSRITTNTTTVSGVSGSTSTTNLPNQGSSDQTPLFAIQTTNDLCKNFQGYYNSSTDNVFNVEPQLGSNGTPSCSN